MANIKISSLEETKINNPDASFVMVVTKDDASNLYKNYRISLTELRNIIGSIEGDIVTGVTEEQVKQIVANAIDKDNENELSTAEVQTLIDNSIAKIVIPEQGISEDDVNDLIRTAIAEDNRNELTQSQVIQLINTYTPTQSLDETRVQEMINTSITADNLKGTVAEVVPGVIPEVIPDTEIQVEATDEPIVLTVKEVVEKVVVQENTVTEITKEIKEDCVCKDHADDCFNTIFS